MALIWIKLSPIVFSTIIKIPQQKPDIGTAGTG